MPTARRAPRPPGGTRPTSPPTSPTSPTPSRHIATEAGYGGSILDYGFLDAQWDDAGGASGWAAADITEFHNVYLPQTYGTIATFNSQNGTSYTSFGQVPAALPGQPLAGVYQRFRVWSVQTTYGRLTAAVRAITGGTPLYYYFGGHFGNAVNYANIPDLFFALAKQYTVTVIVDAAQSPGLTLTFGSLARAYGVRLAQEWTAPGDSTPARRAGRAVGVQLRHGTAAGRRRGLLHPRRHPEGHRRLPGLHRLAAHAAEPVRLVPAAAGRGLRRLLPGVRQRLRR